MFWGGCANSSHFQEQSLSQSTRVHDSTGHFGEVREAT